MQFLVTAPRISEWKISPIECNIVKAGKLVNSLHYKIIGLVHAEVPWAKRQVVNQLRLKIREKVLSKLLLMFKLALQEAFAYIPPGQESSIHEVHNRKKYIRSWRFWLCLTSCGKVWMQSLVAHCSFFNRGMLCSYQGEGLFCVGPFPKRHALCWHYILSFVLHIKCSQYFCGPSF